MIDIRDAVTKEIARLQKILALLNEDEGGTRTKRGRPKGRRMSAAGRRAISVAQKKRWADKRKS